MPEASGSIEVSATPQDVWRLLADLPRWPRWLRVPYAGASVRVVSEGPLGPGTEFELMGSLPFRLLARITEWEEPRSLRFEIYRSEYPSDRAFLRRVRAGFEIESTPAGTALVTYRHAVEGKGILGQVYMATVFRPFVKRNVRLVLLSIKEAIRGGDLIAR